MKLRVNGNALRFRLNRREVADFATSGRATAAVNFGGGTALVYTLEQTAAPALCATFTGGQVLVQIPGALVQAWASSEQVGLHADQPFESGDKLEIIIEKDFQCLHKGEAGKDPDAYPNPQATP